MLGRKTLRNGWFGKGTPNLTTFTPNSLLTYSYYYIWGKIRQVYSPKNFLSPISLKVREIIVLVNLF